MQKKATRVAEKKEKKRLGLLKSSIKTFARKGFYKTKVGEVATGAGVADGTVYLYFKNKDDLLIKTFEFLTKLVLEFQNKKMEGITDPRARIEAFIDSHIKYFRDKADAAKFISIEFRQSPDFYARHPEYKPLAQYFEFLAELCQEAMDAGIMRKANPRGIALLIFGMMDQTIVTWALNNEKEIFEELKDNLSTFLFEGVKA